MNRAARLLGLTFKRTYQVAKPDLRGIIQPGQHLELLFAAYEQEHRVDVRDTVIYDVYPRAKSFVIAQTQPPVLKSMVGRPIEPTFLWQSRPEDDPLRYAFRTTIQELITDYALSQGQGVQAIRLAYPKNFYARNMRFSYRVRPIKQYPITLRIEGHKEPLPIIEISEGGMCISYTRVPYLSGLRPGDRFEVTLDIDGKDRMRPQVEVVRKFQRPEFARINFLGVKFFNLSMNERALLVAVIKKMERMILRKRAGLELIKREIPLAELG
jgi:hypothetical protein